MNAATFKNPLLSGFYPDPSVCRVNDDYYMVTSSFVYFPGIPVFHSKDLIHWEQIGHGISRPEQLDYKNCETSLGLWAPSIRYHDGTFYIINTFVSGGREAYRDNYIITAKDPAGPWSDPCFIKGADGIDSSLSLIRMIACGIPAILFSNPDITKVIMAFISVSWTKKLFSSKETQSYMGMEKKLAVNGLKLLIFILKTAGII